MSASVARGGSGKNGTQGHRNYNAVHNDAIWRQTIRYELNTANNWESHWGFMRDSMISADDQKTRLPPLSLNAQKRQPNIMETGLPSKIPPGLTTGAQDAILADWLCTYSVPRIMKYRFPSEKYTIPATTANEIGWPWEQTQKKLGMPFAIQKQAMEPRRFASFEEMQRAQRGIDQQTKEQVGGQQEAGEISQARSRVPGPYTLERFGKHARGRGDVLKWFGARESLP